MARPTLSPRPTGVLLAAAAAAALLVGCGDDAERTDAASGTGRAAPPARTAPARPRADPFPGLPAVGRVPQVADRRAPAASRRVAERWFALVRRGEDARAAELMADGTRFVNGLVARLPNRAARVHVAESLPCGAVPSEVGGARGGYVVLRMRLADKVGAAPCDGRGTPVAVAVHVTDGRIDDWVRIGSEAAPADPGVPV